MLLYNNKMKNTLEKHPGLEFPAIRKTVLREEEHEHCSPCNNYTKKKLYFKTIRLTK